MTDDIKRLETSPITATDSFVSMSPSVRTRTVKEVPERAELWYYKPLEAMGTQNELIIMIVIFPLYERFIRHICNYEEGGAHSDSPIVKDLAQMFKLTNRQADHLWKIFRNGMLHRAAPKEKPCLPRYALVRSGMPIEVDDLDQFHINPFALRDLLIRRFRAAPTFLSDTSDYPLPDEFKAKG